MQISVQQVSHFYPAASGTKCALDNVSLNIEPGFTVLLGPNGAGKSTLFSLLTGLSRVAQGDILFDGKTLRQARRHIMQNTGVVFQQSTLDIDLTVRQNLGYFAALQGLNPTDAIQNLSPMLDNLDLTERLDWKVRKLNGGHRRRVEIARCFIHSPSVLLLDEPTVGLDIASRELIVDVVHKLAETKDVTVLWSTHLLEEVRKQDHLILLSNGQIKGDDTCQALLSQHQCDDVSGLFNQLSEAS